LEPHEKLIMIALLVLVFGAWYVGTRDYRVLVFSNRVCPCDLETFTDKEWIRFALCLLTSLLTGIVNRPEIASPYSCSRHGVALAYYPGDKLVDLRYADATQMPLKNELSICKPRSSARYDFVGKGFFLINRIYGFNNESPEGTELAIVT
jgi:hypothetical protein